MLLLESIKNHLPDCQISSFSLPKGDKIQRNVVAIFVILGMAFSISFYLLRSRVTKIQGSNLSKTETKISEIVTPQRSGKTIRTGKFQELVQSLLSPGERLGQAIDTGDCFYDALSQTLKKIGVNISTEQLRRDIADALEDSKLAEQVNVNIEKDSQGIKSFADYKKYVRYSKQELIKLKETDFEAPEDPYWGDPKREGVFLCNKYGFRLRILSAGLIEGKINEDHALKLYRRNKEKIETENDPSMLHFEGLIQQRLAELYEDDQNYFTSDETIGDSKHTKLCSVALFENHFRPIL